MSNLSVFPKGGLARQFSLVMLCVGFLSLCIETFFHTVTARYNFEEETISRLKEVGGFYSSSIKQAIIANDDKKLDNIISYFVDAHKINGVALEKDGKPTVLKGLINEENTIIVSINIMADYNLILAKDMIEFNRKEKQEIMFLLFGDAIHVSLLIGAAIISFYILVAIRLNKLSNNISKVEIGKPLNEDKHYKDEIGVLSVVISNMHQRLSNTFSFLQENERSLRMYRMAVDNVSEMIFWINREGKLIYANNSACNKLSYNSDEVPFLSIGNIDHYYNDDGWEELWDTLLYKSKFRSVSSYSDRNGEVFPVESVASKVIFEDQEFIFLMVSDISERTLAEQRLRHALKLESVGTLAGGIAHDFNNIVAGILGHAFMASEKLSPASAARQNIEHITSAATRAKSLVQQLLSFARRKEPELEAVFLPKLIDEAANLVCSTLPSNVKLLLDYKSTTRLIRADPLQIHQVIYNLCTNAVDAIGDKIGGEIHIETRDFNLGTPQDNLPAGEYVTLSVSDNGSGMDEYVKSRIFDPFFTTKEQGKGTGLGLAAVHGIVSDHNGLVKVKSSKNHGTNFIIFLPAHLQLY